MGESESSSAAARGAADRPAEAGTRELYLELLKKALINTLYLDDEERIFYLRRCLSGEAEFDYHSLHDVHRAFPEHHREFLRSRRIGQFPYRKIHNSGFSHSMIGSLRMDNLHQCLEVVRRGEIAGDLMECGVWRGGACIFMRGYLRAHGMTGRRVIAADSFRGLPPPGPRDSLDLSRDSFPELAVSRQDVERNFELYDLLDDHVVFLEGWFADTLPTAPVDRLALLRLDGDLYDSTMTPLTHLYDRVSRGGIVIVDDYRNIAECEAAVQDFFQARGEAMPPLEDADWTAVWWRKP